MSYEYKIVGYDQNGVIKTELMPAAPSEPQVNSYTYLKAQADLAAAICNYEKYQERMKTDLNTNLFEGYTSPFDMPENETVDDSGDYWNKLTQGSKETAEKIAAGITNRAFADANQPLPPAPDFNEASIAKAIITVRQMCDDHQAKNSVALRQQLFQPKPTNYQLPEPGQLATYTAERTKRELADLRMAVTNPGYDINTQSVSRLLHEEILANQNKNYELKLDAMRREIAELKLSQPRKGCWPPDDAFDDSWHWLVTVINDTLIVDKAKWMKCCTGGFWIIYGANQLGVKVMADESCCIYAGPAEDEKTQPNPADGVYIPRTTRLQNPVTAAPTTTKTTPFPLNALTNQPQRIGLTTERRL